MRFRLEDRPDTWLETAPIRLTSVLDLPAPRAAVFDVLADHSNWPTWFGGMRKVRIDGAASGAGALRTVWVGTTWVQERFDTWTPGERVTLTIVASNTPGLRAMREDWHVEAHGEGARLTLRIAAEPVAVLRPLIGLLRAIVARSTSGATGITSRFPT